MTVGVVASVLNGWLDGTFATATCWSKLHTADPGAAGATAAAAGDTTRKQSTMAAASGGSKSMTGTSGPWTNGGTSETLTHLSMWTASTAGSVNATVALSASAAWVSTNSFTLTAMSITITPVAV